MCDVSLRFPIHDYAEQAKKKRNLMKFEGKSMLERGFVLSSLGKLGGRSQIIPFNENIKNQFQCRIFSVLILVPESTFPFDVQYENIKIG